LPEPLSASSPPLAPIEAFGTTELGLSEAIDESGSLFFIVLGAVLLLLCCVLLVCWPYFARWRKQRHSKGTCIHPVAASVRDEKSRPPEPPPPNVVLNVLSSTRRFSAPPALDRISQTIATTILPSASARPSAVGALPVDGTVSDGLVEHSEPLLTSHRQPL